MTVDDALLIEGEHELGSNETRPFTLDCSPYLGDASVTITSLSINGGSLAIASQTINASERYINGQVVAASRSVSFTVAKGSASVSDTILYVLIQITTSGGGVDRPIVLRIKVVDDTL